MSAAAALLLAQAMPGMDMGQHVPHPPVASPAKAGAQSGSPMGSQPSAPEPASKPRPAPGQRKEMGGMPGMAAEDSMAMAMHMGMGGGTYEYASGTARVPAAEGAMRGRMFHAGRWTLMAHGYAWGTLTHQDGPRGDDQIFVTSMAMLMGDRDLGRFHLQLKGMASLDPYLGPTGYPNLFATGEVAHGRPLVDHQHPHDLVMEAAARVDYRLGRSSSLFLYGGPVAEPALGPAAFMHRGSARYLPLAPITHHWFDSTHITYGVVTAGYAAPHWQAEGSAFRGREPDEHRWDVETPRLDSWSGRLTWTPSAHWAVQASHGRLESPEEDHPDEDERRTTVSVHYAAGGLTTTVAYGLKDRVGGRALPAWLGEAAWEIGRHHTLFGRAEVVKNNELFPDVLDPRHDRPFRVARFEGGYAYRLPITGPLGVALGGSVATYAKPAALDQAYGNAPVSGTLFAKLVLGL